MYNHVQHILQRERKSPCNLPILGMALIQLMGGITDVILCGAFSCLTQVRDGVLQATQFVITVTIVCILLQACGQIWLLAQKPMCWCLIGCHLCCFKGSDSFKPSKLMFIWLNLRHENDTCILFSCNGWNEYIKDYRSGQLFLKKNRWSRKNCILKCKHEDASRDT
jgi:hypothetical protein